MIVWISLAVAVLGGLVYVYAKNPKWGELGRIAFFCGLFAFPL